MIVRSGDQSRDAYCCAALNEHLNKTKRCPANHCVEYRYGWFRLDDSPPFRDSELQARATQAQQCPYTEIGYWPRGNCYIFMPVDDPYDEQEATDAPGS